MVRRSLIAKKIKKPKVTRSEVFLVNHKYMGDEPSQIKTEFDQIKALNWYHSMCDKADARQYLKDYFKTDKPFLKTIDKIPDNYMPYTAAWLCRIANNQKRDLNDREWVYVNAKIKEATSTEEVEEKPKPKVERSSIQDRMREKLSDIIGEVEALIDGGETFSLYDWLKQNEVPAAYAPRIADYYRPIETEMRLAMVPRGQDGHRDGYENWSKPQLRSRAEFYGKLVSDAERYGDVTKKVRKPRKPRSVSVEKLFKNFKYQKESNEYKLASVAPESITGAQELWCFNTRYKTITVFRALDRAGLTVKRSSITNYDNKSSLTKGTGRQTEKVLEKLKNGGKIILKKLMDELKTDKPLQERINENTILVKVVK